MHSKNWHTIKKCAMHTKNVDKWCFDGDKIKMNINKEKNPQAGTFSSSLLNATRIVTHSLSTKQLIRSVLFASAFVAHTFDTHRVGSVVHTRLVGWLFDSLSRTQLNASTDVDVVFCAILLATAVWVNNIVAVLVYFVHSIFSLYLLLLLRWRKLPNLFTRLLSMRFWNWRFWYS